MRRDFGNFLSMLLRIGRAKIAGAVALTVLLSLTEGVGIMMILPMLQLAGMNVSQSHAMGRVIALVARAYGTVGLVLTLPTLLVTIVVLIAIRSLTSRWQMVAMASIQQEVELVLRSRLYRVIAGADWLFICRSRSSDFTHALTAEVERVGALSFEVMGLLADLIMSLVYLLIALRLAPMVTVIVAGGGLLLMIPLRRRVSEIHDSGTELSDETKELYSTAIEHLQGLKSAKAYDAIDRNFAIFSQISERVARVHVDTARAQVFADSWFELGSTVIMAAAIYVALEWLHVRPAEVLILLLLFSRVMPRLRSGHQYYRDVVKQLPAFTALTALESRCAAAAEATPAAGPLPEPHRSVALSGVWFAYAPGREAALRGLDLEIAVGRITALVGSSGAGKSTAADIVMGLLTPDAGVVRVDDSALTAARLRAWRKQVGYVGPDTFLFHDTIRNNLLWARPDADEPAMREALALAAATEFVDAMPHGLDTVVGDRGALVSQGERQRLALARAMLRRPALLILDEATNSLDSENEARVLGAIEKLRGRLTVVLIAHRLSTIRHADVIHVIEGGRVVETGEPVALTMRPDSRFKALCEAHAVTA